MLKVPKRQAIDEKLREVRATQGAFWDALLELEEMAGLELCSDVDYEDYEVDDLDRASEREQHWRQPRGKAQ